MSSPNGQPPSRVAIACGGTGGHLFPGLAIADELRAAGCEPLLLISQKEIDRLALKGRADLRSATLPAVGLAFGGFAAFARGFAASYRQAVRLFRPAPPAAVLSMGGFTGAPPVLAGRRLGARAFLHESNSIPGKANRWISWVADTAFVGFPSAAKRLHASSIEVSGTPVRPGFIAAGPENCRRELGLDPAQPVLLVTGGSQGAHAVNELVAGALKDLVLAQPGLQLLWLTGSADADQVRQTCSAQGVRAQIYEFFDRMGVALGAATLAVSRAGASSLAELAAVQLPCVLIPYPSAADNHQLLNAKAYAATGAAVVYEQATASPPQLASLIAGLLRDSSRLAGMRHALAAWHRPDAAARITAVVLAKLGKVHRGATTSGRAVKLVSSPGALA